MMKGNQ